MWLTEEKAAEMYREAKNKKAEIKIISEIMLQSEEETVQMLKNRGIEAECRKKRTRKTA